MKSIYKINLPKKILNRTYKIFKKYANEELEVIVIWVGEMNNKIFDIKDVWEPIQYNSMSSYYIPDLEVHNINVNLNKNKLTAIAQIHTHPDQAFHSWIDDEFSILHLPCSFSIVVPNFGENIKFNRWNFFRLTNGKWEQFPIAEVKLLFKITT